MALTDDALGIQSPTGSVIPTSSAQCLQTVFSNLLAYKNSVFLRGTLLAIPVVMLSVLMTHGAAEPRDLTPRQFYRAAFMGQAAKGVQADEAPVSFSILKDLASQGIRQDPAFLGKVRFIIDPKNHTFSVNLAPLPSDLVLSKSDANAPVLEALIRLAAFQRDLETAFPGEDFWRAEVAAVEQAVRRCIETTGSAEPAGANPARACLDQIDNSFSILKQRVVAVTTARGLEEREGRTRGVPGYPVNVAVVPPRAKLRVMTLLEYKKCQYLHMPKEQYEWMDLVGSTLLMIGRYRYRVEWPADLNGPDEGDIEITGPQNLTFTPSR